MRLVTVSLALVLLADPLVTAPVVRDARHTVALKTLVPAGDPLHGHDLEFDARFAVTMADAATSTGDARVDSLALLPAASHLLAHARQFDYSVPQESAQALVGHLLTHSAGREAAINRAVAFFMGPLLDDPRWIDDTLRYLPDGFRFRGSLFLVAGYDIGVALAPNASLNAAHAHFDGHPRELLYYAIHELHHVGFMTYAPPPRMADVYTCADLLRLVNYCTALEGTAVLAAFDRRAREHALADDEDYRALADEPRMRQDEAQYLRDYDYVKRRATEAVDADALAVVERMSGGERLWYRVGAQMAREIERASGRSALTSLIASDPTRLVDRYRRLRGR
jgi:hypothetical protein